MSCDQKSKRKWEDMPLMHKKNTINVKTKR